MSFVLRDPPTIEYEHLVWCPTCKGGIVMWSNIADEGNVSHSCFGCGGPMQVFHRGCSFPSPIRREVSRGR